MNDLKFLELPDGKKYPMCLSINVMAELQKNMALLRKQWS